MAPKPRGCGAAGPAGSQSLRSEQGRPSLRARAPPRRSARAPSSSGDAQWGRAAAAPSAGRRISPPAEPRTPTSALRAQLLHGARLAAERRAARSRGGGRAAHPAERTWRLWLWCFCRAAARCCQAAPFSPARHGCSLRAPGCGRVGPVCLRPP